jgi:hypothetical protein
MSAGPLTLDNYNAVCQKAEGRDKLARFFQYAARFVLGMTANTKTGTTLKTLNDHARSIMVQLATARRTHRWCKEFPVIQGIPKTLKIQNPLDMILELAQKTTLATFMIIDHIGWLKQMKILSGGKRAGTGTIQLGLSWFCMSNAVAAIIQGKKLAKQISDGGDKDTPQARRTCSETIAKHLFLVVQTAHLSRVYETNDKLVGFLGMITSLQDFMPQWPQVQKEKAAALKISPDAKALPK